MKLQAAKQTQQAVSYLQMQQQQLQAIQQQVQVHIGLHFLLNELRVLCVIFYTHSMPLSVSLSVYIFPSLILPPSFPFRHSLTRTHTHIHTHTFTLSLSLYLHLYHFLTPVRSSLPHTIRVHHLPGTLELLIEYLTATLISLAPTSRAERLSRSGRFCDVQSIQIYFLIYHV